MTLKVRFKRKRQLDKKFRQLVPAAKAELAKAADVSADRVLASAINFAPKGRTGKLKRSGRKRLIIEPDRIASVVGFDDPKARIVEFGTQDRVQTSTGKSTGRAPPRPFLFPAYRINLRGTKSRFTRAMTRSIKKVSNK